MASDSPLPPDRQAIRSHFPALQGETVFLENAGGSQVPKAVADRMHDYLMNRYVQLDAGYPLSRLATETVDEAHDFVNRFMNGTASGKVAFGPSCSALCRMLADCYGAALSPGDEVIVAENGHEANAGPWFNLERFGLTVWLWSLDSRTGDCPLEGLEALLTDRTRIVALPHVSNLLGGITDIKAVTGLSHRHGARVVVDGVAFAPHRHIDVAAWDVDWYAYSFYKVYGPHMAVLYGKHEAFAELKGPNHYFIPEDAVPYKFELGGSCHEGCAGILALREYLNFLAGRDGGTPLDRQTVIQAFEVMTQCELPLQERMIRYLLDKPGVRIVGPKAFDASRVGTISFLHDRVASAEIAKAAHARSFGIRNGHMYAHRLLKAMKVDPEDGVVRVSLLHYNTEEEIDGLIKVFETVL